VVVGRRTAAPWAVDIPALGRGGRRARALYWRRTWWCVWGGAELQRCGLPKAGPGLRCVWHALTPQGVAPSAGGPLPPPEGMPRLAGEDGRGTAAGEDLALCLEEFCPHSIELNGLCASCGQDISMLHHEDIASRQTASLIVSGRLPT